MPAPSLLNSAWMLRCLPEARRFEQATHHVARAQAEVLTTILRDNTASQFGQDHFFDSIGSVRDFQRRVPPSAYDDYRQAIGRISHGQSGILTAEPVRMLQPTSGTTTGQKLIPLTTSLRLQFQRAVATWIYDLFRHRPALRRGRAYWSISPARPRRRARWAYRGPRIGFDDDADYLGSFERAVLRHLLAVPADISRVYDIASFRYCTLWHLLRASDLALVSIWNPTFLVALLDPVESWIDRLCEDIALGQPRPDAPLKFRPAGVPDPRRAAQLRDIWRSRCPRSERFRHTWPNLGLISCWTDAGAADCLPALRAWTGDIELQPKGLLATEGCISIPFLGRDGAALAIRSHFLEFEELDAPRVHLAHALDAGGRYRVLLTTGGGLYRYQLRDVVEVSGRLNQCPLVRFLGKADCISDMVGEKLAESHVGCVLRGILGRRRLSPGFALLVPLAEARRYRLYLQGLDLVDVPPSRLAASLEHGLRQNPHYAWARDLRQLGAAEVVILDPRAEPARGVYERRKQQEGMRLGDIKPMALDTARDWPHWLDPLRPPATPGRAGQTGPAAAQIP